ncbi:FG-GAP-like repeat-containing protein [Vibrio sp. 99-8-1]|uniref:FG-GAP-like repeat-containing protein n=1 Tax=Vibrio sp. 99-8-1 TaxID=2607602 RepID=UPI0014933868|nr:FG-GAP-like repeat-containing protein [Vibrio sp. 99-8-1]NOI65479.1 hypothetical protein [Vibrio sp. 99-8-1]
MGGRKYIEIILSTTLLIVTTFSYSAISAENGNALLNMKGVIPNAIGSFVGGSINSKSNASTFENRNVLFLDKSVNHIVAYDDETSQNEISGVEEIGTASVGISGDAKYSYSFPLPKGVNGFTPSLGIHYSSANKQGLLGYGWTLFGNSAIRRCKASYFADNYAGSVNGDNRDRLCFDGMKLVNVDGEYGTRSTEYRTLSDTYQKIVLHNAMSDADSWFEVWDAKGVRSEYRKTFSTDFGVPLAWHITKKTDTSQNSILYIYNDEMYGEKNSPMLSAIQYNNISVVLRYEHKKQPVTSYIAGKSVADKYRLDKVRVINNETYNSFLELTAQYSNNNRKDILNKILLSRQHSPVLTAFNIEWEQQGSQVFSGYKKTRSANLSASANSLKEFVDVDGDGFPDVVAFRHNGVYVSFGDKNGEYSKLEKVFNRMVPSAGDWNPSRTPRVMGDVNGDGKADIVGFGHDGVYVALSNGRSFDRETRWVNAYGVSAGGWAPSVHIRTLADVNGDGLADVVGFSNYGVNVSLSTGYSFTASQLWVAAFGHNHGWSKDYHIRQLADVNGDGMADVVGISHSGVHVALSTGESFNNRGRWLAQFGVNQGWSMDYHDRYIQDVNGDGMADVVGFSHNGVEVALSTGKRFMGSSRWARYYGHTHGWRKGTHLRLLSDLDGDGFSDVIGFARDSIPISMSSGSSFYSYRTWLNQFGPWYNWRGKPRYVMDINGDGRGDVLGLKSDGIYRALGNYSAPRVKKITTATGNYVTFKYGNLSDPTVYKKGDAVSYPQKNDHRGSVVTSLFRSNGIGGENETQYKYQGKRVHLMGAGNLGFEKIHQWNRVLNRVESRTFHQNVEDGLLYSALEEKTTCQLRSSYNYEKIDEWFGAISAYRDYFTFDSCSSNSSKKIEHISNTWQTETAIGNMGHTMSASPSYNSPFVEHQRYKQQLLNSTTKTWDLEGTLLKTVSVDKTYNKWFGHTLTEVTNTDDHIHGSRHTEAISYRYKAPDTENWLVNLLAQKSIQVTGSDLYADDGVTTFNQVFDYEYNSKGQLIRRYQQKGTELERSTTYSDFDRGLPQNVTERWSKDLSKNILYSFVPINHRTTLYTYDKYGYIATTTNALGQIERTHYEPLFGKLVSVTAVDGTNTTYHYDAWGRETGVNTPSGSWQRINYKPSYNDDYKYAREITSNNEPTVIQWFDSQHRLLKSQTAIVGGQSYTHYRYDDAGNIISESVPSRNESNYNETQFSYDSLLRIKTITKASGYTTNYRYSGFTTVSTNSEDQSNTTIINALGQKQEVIDDAGNRVTYHYDGWGNLTRTNDPNNNQIRITYNALGHRTKMIDPDLGKIEFKTNGLDLVYQYTNNRGESTKDYFDLLGRKIKRIDPETPSGKHWQYNSKGQLTASRQTGYYQGFSYYPNGLLQQKTVSILSKTYRQQFNYDANGRPYQMDYGNNVVATYQYNDTNILSAIYLSSAGKKTQGKLVWSLGGMDAFGHHTRVSFGNNLAGQYHYDPITGYIETMDLVGSQQQQSTSYLSNEYDFDSIGNLTYRKVQVEYSGAFGSAQHHFNTQISEHIVYDNLNRLSSVNTRTNYLSGMAPASGNSSAVTLRYDALGNITYKSDVGNYHYDDKHPHAVNRISGKTTQTFRYDDNGNQISGMGRSISYSSFNKPTKIRKGNNVTRFKYGTDGQRYLRTDSNDEGTTTTTYLDSTEIIRQPNGQITFRYYIGDVALYEKTVASLTSNGLRYLHKDHLGSIVAISGEEGQIEQRFSYDAWGKRRESSAGIDVNEKGRIGFTGHEMLDDVGLIHMNGRVYDPTLGRFLSADPFIQDNWFGTQAFNRYSYVQNNPLSYTDPTGLLTDIGTCAPTDTRPECTESREPGGGNDNDGNGSSENKDVAKKQAELKQTYGNDPRFIDGFNTEPDAELAVEVVAVVVPVAKAIKLAKYATPPAAKSFIARIFNKIKSVFSGKKVDDIASSGKTLTTSQNRTVSSLTKRIEEHKKKLEEYKNNPDAFDNKSYLKNAPNSEIRQRIIDGRVRHLEKEIRDFQKGIDDIIGG